MAVAARLSDDDLVRRLELLAAQARETTVELVAHLAELDRRKLYLPLGYGSLFAYCTGALRLSEHASYNRIEAARVCRQFPLVLKLLADGSLNLTTLRLVAPHLTAENHRDVLKQASGRSKRDIEELVARLCPRPDAVVIVRRLPQIAPAMAVSPPSAATASATAERPFSLVAAEPFALPHVAMASAQPPSAPRPRPAGTPLAADRYRLQFNVDRETQEKLRHAQDLLRREIPDGDPGAIFGRALTLLLDDIARKKLALTAKPKPGGPGDPHSRHLPANVRRAVWLRDGARCAYVGRSGRRCGERAFLEFHHVKPYAVGGEPTVDNIALRCRAHNVYEAELAFGPYAPLTVQERRTAYVLAPQSTDGCVWLSGMHSTRSGTS